MSSAPRHLAFRLHQIRKRIAEREERDARRGREVAEAELQRLASDIDTIRERVRSLNVIDTPMLSPRARAASRARLQQFQARMKQELQLAAVRLNEASLVHERSLAHARKRSERARLAEEGLLDWQRSEIRIGERKRDEELYDLASIMNLRKSTRDAPDVV